MICSATARAALIGIAKPSPSAHRSAFTAPNDQRVDPDHLAGQVDQRSTRVSLVDRCVGLDQTFNQVALTGFDRPSGRTDDPNCDGILKIAKRGADCDHAFSGFQSVGISQASDSRREDICFQHGQVGVRIRSDDLSLLLAAIREDDADLICTFYDMVVGQDVALRRNEKPASADRLVTRWAEERHLAWGSCLRRSPQPDLLVLLPG